MIYRFFCRFGRCMRCEVHSTPEGIGGRCLDCNRVYSWVSRYALRAYAKRMQAPSQASLEEAFEQALRGYVIPGHIGLAVAAAVRVVTKDKETP